jgi:Zn-dependent M28 family amino/carboxypeptidase
MQPCSIAFVLCFLFGCTNAAQPDSGLIAADANRPTKQAPKQDIVELEIMADAKRATQDSDLAYNIVASLTSEVGPRIAGSSGDKQAVTWAKRTMTDMGFDKIYQQPVRVRNWERGFAQAQVTSPESLPLVITALGGSVATPAQGLAAEVVRFASLDELRAADPNHVTGKIVYLDTKMQRHKAGRFYGKVVPNRVRGAVEAAKQGALAVIIRSVGTANSRFAHTGVMRYDDTVNKIPAGAISNIDADALSALMARSTEPVTLSLIMQAKETGWQTSYNVIGEITGSESPEEVVLISAHLDSWDLGTGALDDGAGVGIVMAAAKLLKDNLGQPKRTIRVILYAAEEIGLLGGYEYARANEAELSNIIVAAESDFGAGRIYRLDTRFAPDSLSRSRALFMALAQEDIPQGPNDTRGGPDVSMLPNYGVPVFSLKQDGTYYFDYHHTADDTLDKIDRDAIRQNQMLWGMVTAFFAYGTYDPRPAPPYE